MSTQDLQALRFSLCELTCREILAGQADEALRIDRRSHQLNV